jgi:plastocyanin
MIRRGVALGLLAAVPASARPTGEIAGSATLARVSVGSRIDGPEEVLVFIEDAPDTGGMPEGPFAIVQSKKAFHPSVLLVPRGAVVDFPNHDDLHHNVFSLAPGGAFDLGLYGAGEFRSATFDRAGIFPVYCNIHPQMVAHVVVLTNPFYTRPAADGRFRIRGIPPGRYQAVAWLPFAEPVRQAVEVQAGRSTDLHFTLRERAGAGRHLDKSGLPYARY